MKLVKIFGVVMAVHAAVFMFIFAVPGCRSTGKKPVAPRAVVGDADSSPVAATESSTPTTPTAATSPRSAAYVPFLHYECHSVYSVMTCGCY